MASTALSSVFGMLRNMYIAWVFGRGMQADAFLAAFQLPDMVAYFLVGGAASITFVTILTRYRERGPRSRGPALAFGHPQHHVSGAGRRPYLPANFWRPGSCTGGSTASIAAKAALCVHLTRILLPAQLFFFAGGVFGAVLLVRKQFTIQAVAPLIYNLGTILGGIFLVHRLGVSSLAWVPGRDHRGPIPAECLFCPPRRHALSPHARLARPRVARVGEALIAVDDRRLAGDRRHLDHRPLRLLDRRRHLPDDLCEAALHRSHGRAGAGRRCGLHAVLRQPLGQRRTIRVCHRGGGLGLARGCRSACSPPPASSRSPSRWSRSSIAAGSFPPATPAPAPLTLSSSAFPCFCGPRRPSTRALFTPRETRLLPMVAGTIVTVVSLADLWHRFTTLTAPWAWPSRRTSASPCRPWRSPCCCTEAHGLAGQPRLSRNGPLPARGAGRRCRRLVRFHLPRRSGGALPAASLVGGQPCPRSGHAASWRAPVAAHRRWVLERSGSALPRVAMRRLRLG